MQRPQDYLFFRPETSRGSGKVRQGLYILLCGSAWLTSTASVQGQDAAQTSPRLQPFSYQANFEEQCPDIVAWAEDGPSHVNFAGPSEERVFEGKRSLKLDVTLEGGSYHYFGVPARALCAGDLKLSARVFVGEATTARVRFGVNMVFPPTAHSGCGSVFVSEKPMDHWQLAEMNLTETGRADADGVMEHYTATIRGDEVGVFLDRWSLFISGTPGQRAVVYLDDVRIEGAAPSEEDYMKEVEQRWAGNQERLRKRMDAWRAESARGQQVMSILPPPPESLAPVADQVRNAIEDANRRIGQLAQVGYGSKEEVNAIEEDVYIARHGAVTVKAMAEGVASGQSYVLFVSPAIRNPPPWIAGFPVLEQADGRLRASGCRGEFEPVMASVYALENIGDMRVSVSNLSSPDGVIPADSIDIRAVKCWYQAGVDICTSNAKILVPELLLKDSELVRVDRGTGTNYLRSTAEDGAQTYLPCSGPASENLAGVRPMDALELRPVPIPAHTLQPFWFTIHIPSESAPGVYSGEIAFQTSGAVKTLPIEITVHAFALLPPRLTYSIYYEGRLAGNLQPPVNSTSKTEEQYRAELGDMLAHGVSYPTSYEDLDERVLQIRKEAGFPAGRLFTLGQGTGNATDPAGLAQLSKAVGQWLDRCRSFGYANVYFYGADEAGGEALLAQRDAWRTVQEAGGRTFAACSAGSFEVMGPLLNCAVFCGRPDPEEAHKWHSVGSEIFCYAYPQVGHEEPETYRRNYGLVLWAAGYDGAMDYAYHRAFGHIWNDFDHPRYRDHCFTYPAINGVVGTVQWEGFREAVDDVRYVTTLERAIADAPPEKTESALQARQWLSALEPYSANLYETREQIMKFIGQLR